MIGMMYMELWQILVICILMLPAFFILNYIVVTRAARERRARELRVEQTVASWVGRDYGSGKGRFVNRRYRPRRPGKR